MFYITRQKGGLQRMLLDEIGVSPNSERYFSTPSSFAKQIFYYVTRIGHYYADRRYRFSNASELAQEPTHNRHFCMVYILKGGLHASLDQEELSASAGTVFLYDCRRPHRYQSSSDDTELLWMCFDGISAELRVYRLIELNNSSRLFMHADTVSLKHFLQLLLVDYQMRSHTSEIRISEYVYACLCSLMQQHTFSGKYCNEYVTQAMHYMDMHFDESIHVSDVAKALGLSTSYLTKCFRTQTGSSPYEYLTLQRISHAKNLLCSTDMTLRSIAYACGYNSEENFIRTFRQHAGQTPGDFRRDPV